MEGQTEMIIEKRLSELKKELKHQAGVLHWAVGDDDWGAIIDITTRMATIAAKINTLDSLLGQNRVGFQQDDRGPTGNEVMNMSDTELEKLKAQRAIYGDD